MHLFDHLAPAYRARLDLLGESVELREGVTFVRRGERSGDVFRLVSGQLEVVDDRAQPELVLNVLGPGAVVGEMAFVQDEPRSANVRTSSPCLLLRWQREVLHEVLEADPAFAADFYRAVSLLMAARLRGLSTAAATGALAPGVDLALSGDAARRADALLGPLKAELVRLEAPLRAADPGAGGELGRVLEQLQEGGRRLFSALGPDERRSATEVVRRELSPYLLRARLAELVATGGPARSAALTHIQVGEAAGVDALGRALDGLLLGTPSAVALRTLPSLVCEVVIEALGDRRSPRLSLAPCGSGALLSALATGLADRGADVTCVDAERDVLELAAATVGRRPPAVRLRLVQEDLAAFVTGRGGAWLGDQDLVVLDGLVEFLPERLLATTFGAVRRAARPGAWLVLGCLGPTDDDFLFGQVLGWPAVRRPPEVLTALLTDAGFAVARTEARGAAVVVSARLGTLSGDAARPPR